MTIDGSGAQVQVDGTQRGRRPRRARLRQHVVPELRQEAVCDRLEPVERRRDQGRVERKRHRDRAARSAQTRPKARRRVGNYTGIEVDGTATIDGSGTGNLFTANTTGLAIFGTATVQGGYFGPAGGAAGNSLQAILIQSGSPSIQIGTGVTITGNGAGVRVLSPSTGIKILGNRIGSLDGTHPTNTGGGIVFGFDNGHTPNDTGDGDSGPNGLQNYPQLQGAYTSSGQLNVTGTLNSAANTDYTVQVFASGSCDSSGYGEGVDYLGDLAGPYRRIRERELLRVRRHRFRLCHRHGDRPRRDVGVLELRPDRERPAADLHRRLELRHADRSCEVRRLHAPRCGHRSERASRP